MKKKFKIISIVLCIIIFIIYISSFIISNNKSNEGIIVLAYHHFLKDKDKEKYWPDNYYVMATEKFEEQMKYLKENGYKSISPSQIECYLQNKCKIPQKAFIVTIDDGNISSYYEALPILEKYDFYSINFVISGRIENNSYVLDDTDKSIYYFLGNDLIADINKNHPKMIIGSHSHQMHSNNQNGKKMFETKNYEELLEDAKTSYNLLNETRYMAYPFGAQNENYQKAVKEAGFSLAFTFKDNRKLTRKDNPYTLPRIDIRATDSIKDFKNKIEGKVTLKNYTKNIIKSIIGKK